jgi:hypothetical protein
MYRTLTSLGALPRSSTQAVNPLWWVGVSWMPRTCRVSLP